jgi:hypothetical protein
MKSYFTKTLTALCAAFALSFGTAQPGFAFSGQDAAPVAPLPESASSDDVSASVDDAQSPAPAFIEGEGPGWLRAYATGDLPAGERMLMADYYETEIEMAVRKELAAALAQRGIETSADDDSASFQISYSATYKAAGKKGPPKSALRIEPDSGGDRDPSTFGRKTPETGFRPAIAIGGGGASNPKPAALSVSIFVVGGGARVWSGYAQTELGGRSPRELARILTSALMAHWGEDASFDDVRFVDAAAPGTQQ